MKKIRLLLAIVLFMIVFGFTACDHSLPQTSGTEPNGSGNTVSKYQVGDIVLNDGSYLRDATSVSDEDKEKAIAVIYKVDGAKAYGVGLVHSKAGLAWCLETANGYDTNFTELQCTILGNPGDLFEDTDGSDNFEKIGEALIAAGKTDDTKIEGNYPAFEFAKNYKGQANSHVSGTDFENGWYLPTISELYDIWKVKVTVDDKSYLCGGSQFSNVWWYLSSSQFPSSDYDVDVLDFSFGDWAFVKKNDNLIVCCIRVFN